MRRSSGLLILVFAAGLSGSLVMGAWQAAHQLTLTRTVNEGRTVADMAENVGRWASQYGGVHARTQGAQAALPGTFLTRSVYAVSEGDSGILQGSKTDDRVGERQAMDRIEAYHWKNPALVQRELADVLAANGSRSQYRMTAESVLNRHNAPNGFELEAIHAIQKAFARLPAAQADALRTPSRLAATDATPLEYWRVEAGRLLYARAVMAQASCLKCHDTPDKAPEFIRTNQQFNGGGGFGYKAGQPVGVISVTVPLPSVRAMVADSMSPQSIAALAVAVLSALGLLAVGLGALLRRPGAQG